MLKAKIEIHKINKSYIPLLLSNNNCLLDLECKQHNCLASLDSHPKHQSLKNTQNLAPKLPRRRREERERVAATRARRDALGFAP
jgi:hypothetical protein